MCDLGLSPRRLQLDSCIEVVFADLEMGLKINLEILGTHLQ